MGNTSAKIKRTFNLTNDQLTFLNGKVLNFEQEFESLAKEQGKSVDQVLREFKQAYDSGLEKKTTNGLTLTKLVRAHPKEFTIFSAFTSYRTEARTAAQQSVTAVRQAASAAATGAKNEGKGLDFIEEVVVNDV